MAYDRELADRLRELLAAEPGLSEKAMFGGLAFLIDGAMAVAASRDGGLMVRVDPAGHDAVMARPHAQPMVMRGRELDGWARVEAAGIADDASLREWVEPALAWVKAHPRR